MSFPESRECVPLVQSHWKLNLHSARSQNASNPPIHTCRPGSSVTIYKPGAIFDYKMHEKLILGWFPKHRAVLQPLALCFWSLIDIEIPVLACFLGLNGLLTVECVQKELENVSPIWSRALKHVHKLKKQVVCKSFRNRISFEYIFILDEEGEFPRPCLCAYASGKKVSSGRLRRKSCKVREELLKLL